MNNQNPLIPQGSTLEQKNKGRARVKIAVFFVLAIHGVGLMALLMQGCGQSTKETAAQPDTTVPTPAPTFVDTNPAPAMTSSVPVVVANPTPPEIATPVVPAGATEYTIVKGDNFSTLHKKFNVSVKAITEANPGVDSTKLKIGQKIHIPAPAAPTAPTVTGTAPVDVSSAGGEQTYKVKSGDNLTRIAAKFGTTAKALQALNGLKTTSIKVGQVLKVPTKAAAPAPVPAPVPAPATEPVAPAPPSTTTATPPGR